MASNESKPTEPGLRVLLLKDDAGIRSVVGRFLEGDGQSVGTANDGVQALKKLQGHKSGIKFLPESRLGKSPGPAAEALRNASAQRRRCPPAIGQSCRSKHALAGSHQNAPDVAPANERIHFALTVVSRAEPY